MRIFRQFKFDAAHRLNHLPEGHKCAQIHGHTYTLTVFLDGEIQHPIGWIRDFADIKGIVEQQVLSFLDHVLLNDVSGLEQPTTECIAQWIWDKLIVHIPELETVELWENQNSGAVISRNQQR